MDFEISNSGAYIKAKKKGLVYLPIRGWLYSGADDWENDDTLTVTGKHIISCVMSDFELNTYIYRANLS